jgi:hypothetical protein
MKAKRLENKPTTQRKKLKVVYKPKQHDQTEDLLYRGSGW